MCHQNCFFNNDCQLPVYKQGNQRFSLETLSEILLTDFVPFEKVCSKQPVQVSKNMSFAVDLYDLDDPVDIRADENGIWARKGSPVAYISLHTKDKKNIIHRRSKLGKLSTHFKVTYYQHACSPDFNRIITVSYGKQV